MSDLASPPWLNKAELAQVLKCSLPTLDAMLRRWPDFPVVTAGRNGVPWEFSAAEVQRFLAEQEAARAAAGRVKDDLMQQYTLPDLEPETGITPSNALKMAQLRKLEREEQKEAGFLVQTSEVRAILTDTLSRLNRDTHTALRQALRDHNIPETAIRSVEARLSEAQRRSIATLQPLLNPDAPHAEPQPALL